MIDQMEPLPAVAVDMGGIDVLIVKWQGRYEFCHKDHRFETPDELPFVVSVGFDSGAFSGNVLVEVFARADSYEAAKPLIRNRLTATKDQAKTGNNGGTHAAAH